MTEAYSLLQKSIIRVEEEDVNIDDALDDNEMNELLTSTEALRSMSLNETEEPSEEHRDVNMDQPKGPSGAFITSSGKISIPYEKFEEIKQMLAIKLHQVQEESDEEAGITQDKLIMWYLEQMENDLDEEALEFEVTVVKKVIKKLLKTVRITLLNFCFTHLLYRRVRH